MIFSWIIKIALWALAGFAASKIIEGDELILEQLNLDQNERELLDHIVLQMESERGLDRSAAIADMRFSYIQKV